MYLQVFDDMTQCNEQEVRRLLPLVCSQRREKALRFKFLQGQYACLKAYEMLTQCLRQETNPQKSSLTLDLSADWNGNFVYNEHGKPFFQNIKDGNRIAGLDFSISHCKNGIAVAVDTHSIGLDIESFHQAEDSLLRYTMNKEEIDSIKSAVNPSMAFTALWTRKEAVLKLEGTGIVNDLHHVLCDDKYEIKTIVNENRQYAYSVATYLKIR